MTVANDLLYSNASNQLAGLPSANQGTLTTGLTGVPVITPIAVNGQLIIGSTAGVPAAATLTGGTGINILNASNSIIINANGGGLTWNNVVTASAAMLVNNGYLANDSVLVTLTLPTLSAQFSVIAVAGFGAGGWLIAQNAGQSIQFSSSTSTVGITGSVASTNQYDCIYLLCVVANTTFLALNSIGNLTVT